MIRQGGWRMYLSTRFSGCDQCADYLVSAFQCTQLNVVSNIYPSNIGPLKISHVRATKEIGWRLNGREMTLLTSIWRFILLMNRNI